MDIADFLHRHGEIARSSTLLRHGASRRDIAAAVQHDEITRVMSGWVATPKADAEQIIAVRSGGRLGCISALRRWGLWGADDTRPHLAMPLHGRRLPSFTVPIRATAAVPHPHSPLTVDTRPRLGAPVRHWSARAADDELDWIVEPVEAIRQVLQCQDIEQAIACVDSALHHDAISLTDWLTIAHDLPPSRSVCRNLVDARADSGLESRIRVRLVRLGHRVDVQVPLPGASDLDLLVDDRVGLDLDGDSFHSTPEQRKRDLAKGLISMKQGIPTVRAGYSHALNNWDIVYVALTRLLALTAPHTGDVRR
ncbi:hypothetical protein [Paramicrobacterium chengjingii]|uniref:hypothetical protein n=1 Tax=Paramicrobacterium chengjingii TaxID=2769067 RepID=UPI00141F809C|nr:hypothetical protein [Microbacterium chengjingii]